MPSVSNNEKRETALRTMLGRAYIKHLQGLQTINEKNLQSLSQTCRFLRQNIVDPVISKEMKRLEKLPYHIKWASIIRPAHHSKQIKNLVYPNTAKTFAKPGYPRSRLNIKYRKSLNRRREEGKKIIKTFNGHTRLGNMIRALSAPCFCA